MPTPGRTSRTIPANGVSSRSPASPVAIRQRPRHWKTYSPDGAFAPPRRLRPRPARAGDRFDAQWDRVFLEARVAHPLGERGADHD